MPEILQQKLADASESFFVMFSRSNEIEYIQDNIEIVSSEVQTNIDGK